MNALFIFFLRLFFCLVAAKLLLRAVGVESRAYILGLTALFMGNLYWFMYLVERNRFPSRPREAAGPLDNATEAEPPPRVEG
jgi:hypothetical protein